MKGCTTYMQGYPQLNDACHKALPHTGANLWPLFAIALVLIVVGAIGLVSGRR